jgi:hypothetical protein
MNKGSRRDLHPEKGGMDKIIKALQKEGVYMGRYMDEKGAYCDEYDWESCTFFVYDKKIRVWGKLLVTTLYGQSQLEEKAKTKLEEITKNGNQESTKKS